MFKRGGGIFPVNTRFWEGRIYRPIFKSGSIFREGGLDSGRVACICEGRVYSGRSRSCDDRLGLYV